MKQKTVNVQTYSENLTPSFFEQAREVAELFKRPVIESPDVEGWAVARLTSEDAELAVASITSFVASEMPQGPQREALQCALLAVGYIFTNSRTSIREAKDEALRLCGALIELDTEAERERAAEVLDRGETR